MNLVKSFILSELRLLHFIIRIIRNHWLHTRKPVLDSLFFHQHFRELITVKPSCLRVLHPSDSTKISIWVWLNPQVCSPLVGRADCIHCTTITIFYKGLEHLRILVAMGSWNCFCVDTEGHLCYPLSVPEALFNF